MIDDVKQRKKGDDKALYKDAGIQTGWEIHHQHTLVLACTIN